MGAAEAELVVEVRYDHISGDRFRHGTRLLRWRPDKAPRQCTFEQLERQARPSKLVREKRSSRQNLEHTIRWRGQKRNYGRAPCGEGACGC